MADKKDKPKYKSQDGFEEVRVYRGFTEIENLFKLFSYPDSFICGGYVRYMCAPVTNPIPAGDVDIYSINEGAYKKLFNVFDKQMKLEAKHENEVSLTFKKVTDKDHFLFGTPTIQLIKPLNEGAIVAGADMQTILENFDFTVIRIGLKDKNVALADKDYIHDETHKVLRLKNIHCPLSSTLRCMKYSKKGYWLPVVETLKLFTDWDERDDDYKIKLMDFLAKEDLSEEDVNELEKLLRID